MSRVSQGSAMLSAAQRAALDAIDPRLAGRVSECFPLSSGQRRLWLLDRLEPAGASYNQVICLRMEGELAVAAMQRAVDVLIARHEVFRTTFVERDGEPCQMIDPPWSLPLDVEDLSPFDADSRESRLDQVLAAEIAGPFDLSAGGLLRVRLFRLDAREHVLLLVTHHIGFDGWSRGVLIAELERTYNAVVTGLPTGGPVLDWQYGDFARWELERLNGDANAKQLARWSERLRGVEELVLPTDRPRSTQRSHQGAHVKRMLTPHLHQAVQALARREKASPFMVLLSAFVVLMQRYSGQNDIAIGSPSANRSRKELEPLIGFFVNTLVLRTDLSGDPTLLDVLHRVRDTALNAFAGAEVPFQSIVDALDVERDLARNPLVQVTFSLRMPAREMQLHGLRVEPVLLDVQTARFDLECYVGIEDGALAAYVVYATELFSAEMIERMLAHYERVLEALVADPARHIEDVELVVGEERRQLLEAWNDSAAAYPRDETIVTLFRRQAESRADAPALEFGAESISYAQLDAASDAVAGSLQAKGIGRGDVVGVLLPRSARMVIGWLGILKAGATYLPLDPSYPLSRLEFMIADAGARLVLANVADLQLPAIDATILLDMQEALSTAAPCGHPEVTNGAAMDAAYIVYTSGSTGEPKGVVVPHRGVVRLVCGTDYLQLDVDDRVAQASNASFDAATFEVWGSLLNGACLVGVDPDTVLDPPRFAGFLAQSRVSALFVTTALFNQFSHQAPAGLRTVDTVMFGGETVDVDAVRRVKAAGGPRRLLHVYGPTECTTFSTWHLVGDIADDAPTIPIGRPLANTRLYVLGERQELLPIGVEGELFIGGDGLALGYLNRETLTSERFLEPDSLGGERVYRTGDRVRWRDDGVIEFVGRRDFQVKIRGFRIELGEVEAALSANPQVHEAVVMCRENAVGDKRLVGYVVLEPGVHTSGEALRDSLGETLPSYMVPSVIMTLPAMPMSLVGKIDRGAFPEPGGGADEAGFVAPSSALEQRIAAIWTELLGIEPVGADDNFFDLGGHSLLATRLVSRIRDALGVELPLRTVFTMPTLRAMAQQLGDTLGESSLTTVATTPIVRRRDPAAARLSFAQNRMWFLSHLDVSAGAYTVLMPLRLIGPLDIARLEWAFSQVVSRHEILRTTFAMRDGEAIQLIHPPAPVALAVQALQDGETCDERRIAGWLSDVRAQGFDLQTGPLWRAAVLRCADDEHVLAVAMHHIATDGWSMDVLVRELDAFYGHTGGSLLQALPIQYADFAEWQMDQVGSDALASQLGYWREQLAHLAALDLPTDRPRASSQTFAGSRRQLHLDAAVVQRIEQLGSEQEVTLFMTMLAVFALLLHRYTQRDDIVVGSPIANRNRAEVEGLIGFFVNTLVMRIDAGGSPTFRELLTRVRDVALAAYAHQDVPFEMLVDELAPARDVSRNPLFQVLFVLQRAAPGKPRMGGLEILPVASRVESTRFDLECHVWHRDDGIDVNLVYNVQLFDDATIERMLDHYARLVAAVVADPDSPVDGHDMLTAAERHRLLVAFNDSAREYPRDRSVQALFEAQASRTPHAIAVGFQDETLTYAELDARANRVAHALLARQCGVGDLVGICMDRSLDLVVAMLGVLKAGCAYVPLDPAFPGDRLAFMMEDADIRVLLTQGRVSAPAPGPGCSIVDVDAQAAELQAMEAGSPAVRSGPDDLAYVIYTSGSTGKPKGVCIHHRALVNFLCSMATRPGIDASDVLLSVTTPSFDIFGLEAYLPLLNGARVQIAPHETTVDADALERAFDEHGVTVMQATPATWKLLIASGWNGRRGLKALCGGEAMSSQLAGQLRERTASLWNMYGPTETTIWSTVEQVGEDSSTASVSIGRPIANTQVYILDADMKPVPVGVAGELCIGGDGVARGYHRRPELTAERFVPDPFSPAPQARMYRTGDLARYLSDGSLQYLGRIDQQVKLRGYRIEPGEIEATLVAHPSVRESVVICREDEPGDERLVAYLVGSGEGAVSPGELRAHVEARLPAYMVPSAFVELDALPLTPNGKIDRRRLPVPDGARQVEAAYVAPRTDLESRVSRLWCELLRIERVGIRDNFFDLGGNSLLIIKMRARIADETGISMPVVELFTHPSVQQIAAYLDGHGSADVDREAAVRRARMRRASSGRRRPGAQRVAAKIHEAADPDGGDDGQ